MKKQFLLILSLVLVLAVLVGLNAVSYTKTEKQLDSEYFPNRSSYNSGLTGTSAFYALLSETGSKVIRWQQPPSALTSSSASKIKTLVLIGEPRRPMTEEDANRILQWVNLGGRLVLIDRFPSANLIKTAGKWKPRPFGGSGANYKVDVTNLASLIDKVVAAKPVQPTSLMRGITAVQPSALASSIKIEYSTGEDEDGPDRDDYDKDTPPPAKARLAEDKYAQKQERPVSIAPAKTASTPQKVDTVKIAPPPPQAPVVHLANADKNILVDYPYGQGRVVFLSDPFIVSNAGIKLVDNSTLAINLVTARDGTIAFDEYHQGFGSENTFLRYFSGTPVPAILLQGLLLIFVIVWTQGRRFGRALPAAAKDRRSKLEYVAAMADLQRSTRAYDLAIENVYTQTRRDMTRLVGADITIQRKQLAELVAERVGLNAKTLYLLMAKCEDIIHGEPTNAKETMNLITELRTLEEKLGLHRNRGMGAK
jgi:Domain of unknown function (DUF4350)